LPMIMEKYQGIKFQHIQTKSTFSYDHRLPKLNHWAYLFSQLGLAPIHASGAYGNHSYRTGETSFVITKSAMIPSEVLQPADFCHVVGFEERSTTFFSEGTALPSSECFLHNALYQSLPHINAILHGHCSLLNNHAKALNIPVTQKFYDYGTQELAKSALLLVDETTLFFILKDHGFVALGKDIDNTGKLTLNYFSKLISLLRMS
jgi:ribulose-5-phosphate 4-epimerase/fuculose-1-phosphate aldolase